ncbi:hypothetical protein QQ045_002733 [Rhodiola kirilowii]
MAEAPPSSNPPPSTPERSPDRTPPPVPAVDEGIQQYWCYSCDKRVLVETEGVEIVCGECESGFVESIAFSSVPRGVVTRDVVDLVDDPEFGSQFSEVLRMMAQAARDEDVDAEREEDVRRRRRDELRLQIRDIVAASGRNRILDWAEILMGLEDNSIELRVELPETDGYFGSPEDYVDAAGYEALLHNLAESDQSGRRGAPAAAKSTVAELPSVVISDSGCEACAICKDGVSVGDSIKMLLCGHGYHEDCIVPWLESRNSCPVCRYELPTDDPEYEEERKKKLGASASGTSGTGLI